MIRVLVCGDRDWTDRAMIFKALGGLLNEYPPEDILVIDGHAPGADLAAHEAADYYDFRRSCFPAHWQHTDDCPEDCKEVVGRPAGNIRNSKMLKEGRPDVVWAFHDDLEHSKGTKDMVTKAEKAGVEVVKFHHEPAEELELFEE